MISITKLGTKTHTRVYGHVLNIHTLSENIKFKNEHLVSFTGLFCSQCKLIW